MSTALPKQIYDEQETDKEFFKECEGVFADQHLITVTCNGVSGVLNQHRLGSGGRGKCIQYEDDMLTPNQFQARCGKASNKDWKKSIKYRGRTLSRLINRKILACHATSCTCAACTDNSSSQSPVRYFIKSLRKGNKRNSCSITSESSVHSQLAASTGLQNNLRPQEWDRMTEYKQSFSRKIMRTSTEQPHVTKQECTKLGVVDCHKMPECGGKKSDEHKPIGVYNPVIGESKTNNKVDLETAHLSGTILNHHGKSTLPPNPYSNWHSEVVNDMINDQRCWNHIEMATEALVRDIASVRTIVARTKKASMLSNAKMMFKLQGMLSTTYERNTSSCAQCPGEPVQSYPHMTTLGCSLTTQHTTWSRAQPPKMTTPHQLSHTNEIWKYCSNALYNLKTNENKDLTKLPFIKTSNRTTLWSQNDGYYINSDYSNALDTSSKINLQADPPASRVNLTALPSHLQACHIFPHEMVQHVGSYTRSFADISDNVRSSTAFDTFSAGLYPMSPTTAKTTGLTKNFHQIKSCLGNKNFWPLALTSAHSEMENKNKIQRLTGNNAGSHSALTTTYVHQVKPTAEVCDGYKQMPSTLYPSPSQCADMTKISEQFGPHDEHLSKYGEIRSGYLRTLQLSELSRKRIANKDEINQLKHEPNNASTEKIRRIK